MATKILRWYPHMIWCALLKETQGQTQIKSNGPFYYFTLVTISWVNGNLNMEGFQLISYIVTSFYPLSIDLHLHLFLLPFMDCLPLKPKITITRYFIPGISDGYVENLMHYSNEWQPPGSDCPHLQAKKTGCSQELSHTRCNFWVTSFFTRQHPRHQGWP